nr:hypothetical protein [uncultured Fluviicola sp.]
MEAIHIEINNRRKIHTIQELFGTQFPNMKLEFYGKPNTTDGSHSDKIVRNGRLTISDCRTIDNNGILIIEPRMTTTELKDYLRETFGLKAELYILQDSSWQVANSGKIPLETFSRLNDPNT